MNGFKRLGPQQQRWNFMKAKNVHKTELTTEELQLLVRHYSEAEDELAKAKSPILVAQADRCKARRQELERMFDGRWTNRGNGRKKSEKPADPTPALPLDQSAETKIDKPY
jgi:hypothetical protein